ncbi:uncharacterized protein LOC118439176 [Folsomia candida]|uniref:uncharacterized protein LOC118439176 n=1 Tax=Folsomia candida TaxID=158441 RepID=UPI0016052183|nr:uncharacterized protein LOC118439176 [Folsomia candida]
MTASGNFTFDQVQSEGPIDSPFSAKVWLIEDKVLQAARQTPYLRVMLTQDDGVTIMVALAIGKSYQVAKNRYEVGKEYNFPGGTFRSKLREPEYQSWSTFPYNLWFNNNNEEFVGREHKDPISRQQSTSSASSQQPRFNTRGHAALGADTDDNWRR